MEYIKSIALFLIFVAFLENVLVFGHMKKYIKLLCGIVLIFILLQPVKELFGDEFDISGILEMNELELRMAEIKEEIDRQDLFMEMIEDNVREIVWEEGCELTYILVTPDEKNSSSIGGISISVKDKNNDISIDRISVELSKELVKEENIDSNIRCVKIGERIADLYGISRENVNVYMENSQ